MQYKKLLTPVLLLLGGASTLQAQEAVTYQKPVKELEEVFFASPSPSLSPDRAYHYMLQLENNSYLSLADLAQPEYRLAGYRFNPDTYSESRVRGYASAKIIDMQTLAETPVTGLPEGTLWDYEWYPDYTRILFYVKQSDGIYLYQASVSDGKAHLLSDRKVNACAMTPAARWLDNDHFLMLMVPTTNQGEPEKDRKPSGPIVQENLGKSAPARTYQDMLKNTYDEALLTYYFTAQPCKVGPEGTEEVGKPAIYKSFSLSPDKQYLLLGTIQHPYSYTVGLDEFPTHYEIADLQFNTVKVLSDQPEILRAMGYDTTSPFARRYHWRNDQPATLAWIEALDGGNPKGKKLEYLDALYQLAAPFTGNKELVIQTPMRMGGIYWCDNEFAMIGMSSRRTRTNQFCSFTPSKQESLKVVFNWAAQDLYAHPGEPLTVYNEFDKKVLYTNANHTELFMRANGACDDGEYPLLYKYKMNTQQKQILWQCKAPYYENVFSYRIADEASAKPKTLNARSVRFVTTRQSLTQPANYYLKRLGSKQEKQLTFMSNPYPSMEGVTQQQIRYKRADGIDLTATVYLPAGYNPERDGRLPVFMHAYPREYRSVQEASQVRGSKYRFTRFGATSFIPFVLRGFCVMQNVEMPIVGTKETEPNDNYIEQLVMDAEAAAKIIYDMGIGDTTRMAVGGHSYGGFMTANLLTHTKMFKAGIARSGAYNRTLTPFGFQSETRTYWEAPEVYNQMSPFNYAHQLSGALLLVHGELDNNTGTYPIQSERLYQALKGHKATTRYVVLPLESHGYEARENLEHLIWEEDEWLQKYVRYAGK